MTPDYVKKLPKLPGIYVFKNARSTIIYVGKAKSLYNRVISYFRKQDDWKVQELIKEHRTVEFILTKNEIEALLLEAQLIRSYKPKYNVLLKNSNPFVYLLITQKDLPELQVVRNKKAKGIYFGPFLYRAKAQSVYEYLSRTLRLRLCSTKIESGCLDFHMGLCAGNCLKTFNVEDYKVRLSIAQTLLEGKYQECEALLLEHLKEHNKRMEFEKSKNLSKYLGDLAVIFETLKTRFTEKKFVKDISHISVPMLKKIERPTEGLKELRDLLELKEIPETIDCFDISHFQSSSLVGSCIRFLHGMPDRNKFRRFKIKTLTSQNDYAALQEIVQRRYRNPEDLPDIIFIDGGKGQLNAIKELYPHITCISLAKREEILFAPNHPQGIHLDIHSAVGQLLIQLRDYAHHFAVSYHKVVRSKSFTK